jgi:hypothetical protein
MFRNSLSPRTYHLLSLSIPRVPATKTVSRLSRRGATNFSWSPFRAPKILFQAARIPRERLGAGMVGGLLYLGEGEGARQTGKITNLTFPMTTVEFIQSILRDQPRRSKLALVPAFHGHGSERAGGTGSHLARGQCTHPILPSMLHTVY